MSVVISNCTRRKRLAPSPKLCARTLPCGPLDEIGKEWLARLATENSRSSVASLYGGRAFTEAAAAARKVQASFFLISAGVGCVEWQDQVPSYSLTIAAGNSDSILPHLSDVRSARAWWEFIARSSRISRRLAEILEADAARGGLLLIALPLAYADMIQGELLALSPRAVCRLRFFTSGPIETLDSRLRPFVMPYDSRLDGPDSKVRGTRSDFASRALRDFAEAILTNQPNAAADAHREEVLKRLSAWRQPLVPKRLRMTDDDLLIAMRTNWARGGESASRMLRLFRDELGIACEQARLKTLFGQLQHELEQAQ